MKATKILFDFINEIDEEQLIFASEEYKNHFSKSIKEANYYKILDRFKNDGIIVKVSKGLYKKPKKTKYGIVKSSHNEIIDYYTSSLSGTIIGYYLYNKYQLTTQVSKKTYIYSNKVKECKKTIDDIVIKKIDLEFNEDIINAIDLLEILENYSFIEDFNYRLFTKKIETLLKKYRENVVEEVINTIGYKKRTIAFLKSLLDQYKIDNNLDKYLSKLSKYSYPRNQIHV